MLWSSVHAQALNDDPLRQQPSHQSSGGVILSVVESRATLATPGVLKTLALDAPNLTWKYLKP